MTTNSKVKPLILLCDDDLEILKTLSLSLKSSFEIICCNTVNEAKKLIRNNEYDAAIIDLNFEGQELDGINLLDYFNQKSPETFLIVLSGDTSVKRAIEATRRKLFEFIIKEENYFDKLLSSLHSATQLSIAKKRSLAQKYLTQSPAIKDILKKVDTIIKSQTDAPILILGETGTGKEFLAQHIAINSQMPISSTNMAAIPKEIAESVLFGHTKGSFTGAMNDKVGLIESANNGIFFLDEIGECSLQIQSKLLRVLQEKEVQPLGSSKTKKIKVRFIAATHCNLQNMVEESTFRQDLYQRLNTFVFVIPPLRERPEDIIFYSKLFLENDENTTDTFFITEDGEAALLSYSWPGNIRELKSVITRICVLSSKLEIDAVVVREAIGLGNKTVCKQIQKAEIVENNALKEELIKAVMKHNGNKRHAARLLGISEATLYRKIKDFELSDILSPSRFKIQGEFVQ